ncbi:unnamed protein product [Thelazia callipaeda]|uniref:Uncharacterized protein n=1 Tax=Thelazia callipaeda TaxID=103827 RepID=A0A0N5D5Z2_THECL|nr:unnamed protein product [Thelazia callipaeda]
MRELRELIVHCCEVKRLIDVCPNALIGCFLFTAIKLCVISDKLWDQGWAGQPRNGANMLAGLPTLTNPSEIVRIGDDFANTAFRSDVMSTVEEAAHSCCSKTVMKSSIREWAAFQGIGLAASWPTWRGCTIFRTA